MKVTISLLIAAITTTAALELPSSIKICSKSDPKLMDCVIKSIQLAISAMRNGLKDFKILPIEPMRISSVKIGDGQNAVSVKQDYSNVKIHGITRGLQMTGQVVDFDKNVIKITGMNPQVDFVADYKLNGKILLLPMYGEGKCNISMHGLSTRHEIDLEKYEKNGETYLRVKNYLIKFTTKQVKLTYENLFNGDPVLGTQMNKFMNENSDIIFKEFEGSFEKTFAAAFANIANKIFSRVPLNKLLHP